jgi:hypothetical protein
MEAAAMVLMGVILIFVLISGLVILLRRGPAELDAWGTFVARVLRGDRRSIDPQASTDIKKRK